MGCSSHDQWIYTHIYRGYISYIPTSGVYKHTDALFKVTQ